MIHTNFDWSEPLNLLLLLAALALLVLQCGLLATWHRQSGGRQPGGRQSGGRQTGRLGIRLGLNVLLWLTVIAWILDPYFRSGNTSKTGLLIAADVPLRNICATAWLLRR